MKKYYLTIFRLQIALVMMVLADNASAYAENSRIALANDISTMILPEYMRCNNSNDCTVIKDVCSTLVYYPINLDGAFMLQQILDSRMQIDCKSSDIAKPNVGCLKDNCVIIKKADD